MNAGLHEKAVIASVDFTDWYHPSGAVSWRNNQNNSGIYAGCTWVV